MRTRICFLNHFVICLAIAAGGWFALEAGVIQTVVANDQSHMTSVIAVVFIGSVAWLGRQAWRVDGLSPYSNPRGRSLDAAFGHLAERLLPMFGLFGTAFGLSVQAKALVGGAAAFGPLATSLYCTACGVLGAALVAVMTFNLEAGIRRAGR